MRKFKEPVWLDNCRIGGTEEKLERVPHRIVCTALPLSCEVFEHMLHTKRGYVLRIKINDAIVAETWHKTTVKPMYIAEELMRSLFEGLSEEDPDLRRGNGGGIVTESSCYRGP
jgi:hypothetical protein